MKTNKMLPVLMAVLLPLLKSYSQEIKPVVRVSNIENITGTLYIGWYDEPEDFRINDKAIYREKLIVSNQSEVSVTFDYIPTGNYAIAVFLDEDDDYFLDRNLFGLPKEKYGFSNNTLPAFRPATFEESSFVLSKEEHVVSIKLK
ncbi:MAG: DUF2141 domain-containing protein [Cytophagales bacterium]|nr:DUF2141 domain-containing protein [Cytophagales bacterium]